MLIANVDAKWESAVVVGYLEVSEMNWKGMLVAFSIVLVVIGCGNEENKYAEMSMIELLDRSADVLSEVKDARTAELASSEIALLYQRIQELVEIEEETIKDKTVSGVRHPKNRYYGNYDKSMSRYIQEIMRVAEIPNAMKHLDRVFHD